MTAGERRDAILAAVRAGRQASVEELAEALAASRETIRRDLTELDGRGLLRKIHGGAVVVEPAHPSSALEGPLALRMGIHVEAKRAIARAAAALLRPGDSLFVDTGSTTLFFAEELAAVPELTVITNSAAIASLAAKGEKSTVFLLGGAFRRGGGECTGEMAIAQIGQFRPAHAFLTVAAVDADGFSDHDFAEAQVSRAMIAQSGNVTILADASKMNQAAPFCLGSLAIADRVVADALPADLASALEGAGVDAIKAAG